MRSRPPVRRSAADRRRTTRVLLAAVGVVTVLASTVLAVTGQLHLPARTHTAPAVSTLPAPWEYTAPAWQNALGGNYALTTADYTALRTYTDPGLGPAAAAALRTAATKVETAELTSTGRAAFPGYWPPTARTGIAATVRCTTATVTDASPAALATATRAAGVAGYAKVLVTYTGTCGSVTSTAATPGVDFVYFAHVGATWQPRRSWDLPAPAPLAADPQDQTEPASWELAPFTCGADNGVFRDRILVVDAFTVMCKRALAAGVHLEITTAFLTRGEQEQRFHAAVAQYGSETEARKWVSYADATTCESRHCSGLAVDVAATTAATGWLTATAGCLTAAGVATTVPPSAATCPATATVLPRMARYGFAAPLPQIPGYLEFTLPVPAVAAGTSPSPANCTPNGVPVPNMVASIFRCRLARAGIVGDDLDTVVREALVVSRCESGWNTSARAFAGRFASTANPADGVTYTEAGVFMITAALADAGWVTGGSAALEDATANINAAASLYIATGGWEQFGCATGTPGGFETGPVLPAYRGPELPAWTKNY